MMFEFDIEDYMSDLEGLTIQEKLEDLSVQYDELVSALHEITDAQDRLIDEYETSVCDELSASVSSLINQNHWENQVTVNGNTFTVNAKPTNVGIWCGWNQDQWVIIIDTEAIASNAKRYETLSNLAVRLNLPYQQGKEDIRVHVEENELQPTIIRIITTLCE